ncbi:MAG: Na/Pi symporter [Acutalibacteraceae bacterium]|nr:Na/Pi symporter [Acutalibacteraceae bacterium]
MVHILNLLCGTGLFLYGLKLMSEGTEKAFGDKMRKILTITAGTKSKAILTGTAVTSVIQSSTAVTVMAVGFVESGVMSIFQATGIVLGANIGTTVTSILIAFNFSSLAPIVIFLSVLTVLVAKNKKIRLTGEIFLGFGFLFLGLNTMGSAFTFLKENPEFLEFIIAFSEGKIKGIVAGIVMTVIMQSSSATVGILQSLCLQGLVDTESSVYIVLGQNIGTVFTSMLSAAGKSKAAKQVGMIHLIFNAIGSLIFLVLGEFIPYSDILSNFGNGSAQVSAFHIIFNVLSVIIFFPFYDHLISISEKLTRFKISFIKKDYTP